MPKTRLTRTSQGFWVANASYPCSTAFIKLALFFQYLRIFQRGTKLWSATVALIVITSLWGLTFGLLAWFPTMPINAYWHLERPATRYAYGTLNVDMFVAIYEVHAAVNLVLDVAVLVVAVPLFLNTNLRKNSYWGLLGLFILGGV